MAEAGIKVIAPASIGNFACGFDVLGVAVDIVSDEIIARPSSKPGVRITSIHGDKRKCISKNVEANTAGYAAKKLLEYLKEDQFGVDFEIYKKVGIGTGLGSSASSACAAVVAVNELLKRPLEKKELLHFATLGESLASGAYHSDNTAPILLGGVQILTHNDPVEVQRVSVPMGLSIVLLYPQITINTKDSREVLKDKVSLDIHIRQSAFLANFVLGMERSDLSLIQKSLHDLIVEPQRAHLIPKFNEVKEAAMNEGAMGCSISGGGPSIFALCQNTAIAHSVSEKMSEAFRTSGLESKLWVTKINLEGTYKC